MNGDIQDFIDDEIEWADYALKCAEDWGKGYAKDPAGHEKLMRTEARLERKIRKVFRDISKKADSYVNWDVYDKQIPHAMKADLQVDVVVSNTLYSDINNDFITITFDTFLLAVTTGAQAGEAIYNIPLGIDSTDAAMNKLTTEKLASLVGKRVVYNPDGSIHSVIDNPNATYRISDATRQDVASSIKTSINLGEDRAATTKRLIQTIDSTKRAEMIARTETVNSYSQGLLEFGRQSNATGKEWESVSAIDICADYSSMGLIDFNGYFDPVTMLSGPAAHPNCRCSLRLAYPPEYPAK